RKLVEDGICSCALAENVPNLYISAKAIKDGHCAEVVIAGQHTNIVKMEKDGKILFQKDIRTADPDKEADKSRLTVKDILDFADQVQIEDISEIIEQQIRLNTAIAQEGLDNNYGAQ